MMSFNGTDRHGNGISTNDPWRRGLGFPQIRDKLKNKSCYQLSTGKCPDGDDCFSSHDPSTACFLFLNSSCGKGVSCKFSHDPSTAGSFFSSGHCPNGDACIFSHKPNSRFAPHLNPRSEARSAEERDNDQFLELQEFIKKHLTHPSLIEI
jgi:hypothetical protein